MENKLKQLKNYFNESIEKIESFEQLEKLRVEILGKKGKLTGLIKEFKTLPGEQKKQFGKPLNIFKKDVEKSIEDKKDYLEKKQIKELIEKQKKIDITLPVKTKTGSLHPVTITSNEIEKVFIGMGFSVEDGPEVVSEFDNFESVNVPENHPARDMQDTFWLENGDVLKTQTSASQNKILKKHSHKLNDGGTIRAIFPGRCFRNEALDSTHENTFFQLEGMVVGKDISVANLIYFMKNMLKGVLKKDINVRLRPGYFPFVEPGFELDASCPFCDGKGCSTCKNSGWIELCPCGMIHPDVLDKAGVNSNEYNGFAFGLGLTRMAMLKYNIKDIRLLNSGNLKFLKQFKSN